ncbi:MAG: N-methyl-L-tryptophan oxidase [Phycisphaerales bacterium]|nr:N-methyl-L-tryptophan oxidase [Phycisphaerales bacterium]
MSRYDVIVVGVGAMGSATCLALARRGVRVLGLERHGIPHDQGSSHGQSRMIRCAYYEHPDYVPLLLRSWELWEQLGEEAGRASLYATGGLYMGPPGSEFVESSLQAAETYGLEHERLGRSQLQERFPQFVLPSDFIAMHESKAGFLIPEWCIEDQVRLARTHGAEIHEYESVASWDSDAGGVVVQTSAGTYTAGHLVLCAGAWMPKLSKSILPLQVTRQVLGWMKPAEPSALQLGTLPVWAIDCPGEGQLYGFPLTEGLPGPTGFKAAMHAPGVVADPNTIDREPRPGDDATFIDRVRDWIPAAGSELDAMRICMYTNSIDEHFIIDGHPDHSHVTMATGFSGHGFKMSSVIGEVLADMSTEGRSDHPVAFLGISRLA